MVNPIGVAAWNLRRAEPEYSLEKSQWFSSTGFTNARVFPSFLEAAMEILKKIEKKSLELPCLLTFTDYPKPNI